MARLASSRICSSRDAAILDVAAKSQKAKKQAKKPKGQEAKKPRSQKNREASKPHQSKSHTKAKKKLDPLKDLNPKRHKHKTRSTNRSQRLDTKHTGLTEPMKTLALCTRLKLLPNRTNCSTCTLETPSLPACCCSNSTCDWSSLKAATETGAPTGPLTAAPTTSAPYLLRDQDKDTAKSRATSARQPSTCAAKLCHAIAVLHRLRLE